MNEKNTILMVEDNEDHAELILKSFQSAGNRVALEWVQTGQLALERLAQKKYSLLLLDLVLPHMDAFDFLELARENGLSTPFIIVTGAGNEEAAVKAMKCGALDYIVKSTENLEALPQIVQDALLAKNRSTLLDAATRRFIEFVENARDAISFHDKNGLFTFVNRKAEELTGYSRGELLHKHISYILPEDGDRIMRSQLRKHKNLRWDKQLELEIKTKGNALIPVELSISPVLKHKKLVGFEVISRDIRERKKAQKILEERDAKIKQLSIEIQAKNMRLEESTRVQTEFVSNISHEFRTPLNGILGYSELLLDSVYGILNERQLSALENIKSCASNLLELVQKILDLSKIKSNQLKLEYEFCSPYDLIDATLGTVAPIAKNNGLALKRHCDKNLPLLYVDFRRIYQVLVILVGNAIKFTHDGSVEVGAERAPSAVKFYVSDTGIGIPVDDQEKIFHEFRQGDSSPTRIYGGVGVGLSLSKKLIELHGGELGVTSRPNEGSKFYFTLPVSPQMKRPVV
ncbi:MAG: ATP-binding protein [bacterium]